jgi:glycine hydroxymethyltransferase
MADPVRIYLDKAGNSINTAFLAYIANLSETAKVAPEIAQATVLELESQRSNLKLIASENYCSLATQLSMGNLLTDKYAEGFPYNRFYEGCDNIDTIEAYACEQAKKLFGAHHAFVQPHSGADANMVAFWGILQARVGVPALEELGVKDPSKLSDADWEKVRTKLGNQKLLGLSLAHGGHLTHGYRHNVSGKMFQAFNYGVSSKDSLLDYDEIEKIAHEIKPLILLAGYSAYPRAINFKRMRQIADQVGAVLMVDMAHFAGLVAGKIFTGDFDPVQHAQVVTTTTHKTLRGPRGGMVLSNSEFAEFMDKGCPFVLGGPLAHVMAAKGVAFTEANRPEFGAYAQQVVKNAQILASELQKAGCRVVSGGTDNHLLLVDVTTMGLSGRQAASALKDCGITCNKNGIPFDKESPLITGGVRLGTPATTSLGMKEPEMAEIASIITFVLQNTKPGVVEKGDKAGQASKIAYLLDSSAQATAQARVKALLGRYPVYPELDLAFLKQHFVKG